jgi:hypothetical protein
MTMSLQAGRAVTWLALRRDRLRRAGLVGSLAVFGFGLVLALEGAAPAVADVRAVPLLALLLVCVPVQQLLNAAEFAVMARYGGRDVGWRPALEVSLHTSAANLLPLPGGALTRVAALRGLGLPLRHGTALVAIGFGAWGGIAFAVSGAWLTGHGAPWTGLGLLMAGVVLLGSSAATSLRLNADRRLFVRLLAVRLATVLLEAVRMALALNALGTAIGLDRASIFVIASFLGSLVSIAPAGLGVREAVVAALAPLVGVDPAAGFLAATLNRAAGLVGLAAAAALLLVVQRRRSA